MAHRQAHGLPATSLNWGPWADAGMAASDKVRANLSKQGLIPLKAASALAAGGEVISHGTAQATVLNANWQQTARLLGPTRPAILEHVLPRAAADVVVDNTLLHALSEVPAAQRADFLTEHLQRELQQILVLASPPPPDSRFLELGMDSLMAVELRNRLLAQFGSNLTISTTVVFDYPTIRGMAEYLAEQTPDQIEGGEEVAVAVSSGPAPTKLALETTVAELVEKVQPLRDIGVTLELNGISVDGPVAMQLEQAILSQEADSMAQVVLADAVLPGDIQPAKAGALPKSRSHALVTGATGYLGGFLVRELLKSGVSVTCIVRCQIPAEGLAKVTANLRSMGIWESDFVNNLRVIPGDVTQSRFGLDAAAYEALTAESDSVFHCAASVRPDYVYHRLQAPNVIGTRNIIEFACTGAPKVLHLPSPASVFLAPAYAARPAMAEDEFPESPLGIVSGYGQSKWAAESLARQARDRGAAVVIYRATALLGASEAGYWSPTDLATLSLSASLATGSLSNATHALDGIPVDVAARFIAAVSSEPANQGQTFHLVHPHALNIKQWAELLTRHDIAAHPVSDIDWATEFESQPSGRLYEGLFEVRGTGVNATIMECLPDQPALESTGFKKALSHYKVTCPDYDKLIERGWLNALRQG